VLSATPPSLVSSANLLRVHSNPQSRLSQCGTGMGTASLLGGGSKGKPLPAGEKGPGLVPSLCTPKFHTPLLPGEAPSICLTSTEGGPGCSTAGVLPASWAPRGWGKSCRGSERGNWGFSLISCMRKKKYIAWHKSAGEVTSWGYSSCLCQRVWVRPGLGNTRGSQG